MTATSDEARIRARLREIASSPFWLKLRDLHDRLHRPDRKPARALLDELVADGKLFAVDQHAQRHARFFTSAAAAQAWVDSGRKDRPVIRRAGLVSVHESQPGSGWRVAVPPAKRAGPLPAQPKVTVVKAPRFDARYGVDPETRVAGGFATMGVGRYLEGSA
jgi:hypothetical protein